MTAPRTTVKTAELAPLDDVASPVQSVNQAMSEAPPDAVHTEAVESSPPHEETRTDVSFSAPVAGEMDVPGDKPLYVIHAPRENRRVFIYLHGMCGDIYAVNSWREVAVEHGTLIALRGDKACGKGRFRWKDPAPLLQQRIERAIAVVRDARGGALDTNDITLMGYSQGAARAERLATLYPQAYRRVILGGPPRQPQVQHLQNASAIAVIGGELETYGHMLAGAEALQSAGKPARFFLLPKAEHGKYGPNGQRVMQEVLHWVLEPDSSLAHGNVPEAECEPPRNL
jgi:predicted esterase